jgi:MFS family permease
VFVHLIPYLIDVGFEPTLASTVVTLLTLSSVLGRYGFGWLSDLFNKKWLLFLLYLVQPIGIFSLIRVHQIMDTIPFVLIYSTAYGGILVVKAALIGDYYGRKNFGTLFGVIQGISTLGGIAGPLLAGLAYDIRGSYYLAFTSFGIMMGLTSLLVLFLKPPVPAR